MRAFESLEEEVVVGMFDRGLLGFSEAGTPLKAGRQSPYYYNMRPSLSFSAKLAREGGMTNEQQGRFRKLLTMAFADKFGEIMQPFDHVFGKAQAGTSPVGVAAYEAGLSYLWERVDESDKGYGKHEKIEGDYEAGELILIGDDAATGGGSIITAIQVLQAVKLEPVALTLEFDREEGGVQKLENEYGLEVNSITTLTNAIGILATHDRIGVEEIKAVEAYHEALRAEGLVSTYRYED